VRPLGETVRGTLYGNPGRRPNNRAIRQLGHLLSAPSATYTLSAAARPGSQSRVKWVNEALGLRRCRQWSAGVSVGWVWASYWFAQWQFWLAGVVHGS
jgi:hypothetical protein